MDNTITDAANEALLKRLDGKKEPGCPFYNKGEDLYLKYDSIRIKNSAKADGAGLEVGYYWKGIKVCIFPVPSTSIDFHTAPNAAQSLCLDGIAGAIKMVLL